VERKNKTRRSLVPAHVCCMRLSVLLLIMCVLVACAPDKGRDRLKSKLGYKELSATVKHEQDTIHKTREKERSNLETSAKKPAFVVEPELPEFNPLEENRISISVRDEPLHDVLFVVARNAGLNLVIDPDISLENRITLSFEDALSSVVVDTLLGAYDLAWAVHDNVLYVHKYEEKTFALEFMNTKSEVTIDSGGDIFGSSSSDSNDLTANFTVASSLGKGAESGSVYESLQKNIEGLIKGDAGSGGSYALDAISGHLYVKTSPKRMKAVSAFVDTLRRKMSMQVVIDAQILEVSLSDDFELGVDWSLVQSRVSNGRSYSYGLGFDSSTGVGTRGTAGDTTATALVLGESVDSAVSSAVDTVFSTTINALETFGGVSVVSNPHIRARHGCPALVTSGTTKSYIKEVTKDTDDDTGDTTYSTDTATAFEGVMLGVMPFINDDKSVDLNIFPITSEVDLTNEATYSDTTITLPQVDVRNVTTNVRAHDGDTIILGGLIYKSSSKSDNAVPGAGEIPGLGWLFNSRDDTEYVRELVIIMHIRVI